MNGEIVTLRDDVDDMLKVAEVEIRMNALGVVVQSKVDKVDVACPFAISE